MDKFPDIDEDAQLWLWLARTRDAIFRAREKELHQYNISPIQSTVMLVIRALREKATPAEISRWIFRESQSVSELLNRMEKEGLVSKVRDLDRKNMVRVELTEQGIKAYHQTLKYEMIHKVMSSLSAEERQQLRNTLAKLWEKTLTELGAGKRPPLPQHE